MIDGLTVTEGENDPLDTNYIAIYDEIENMILKNIFVLKNQQPNGNFICFGNKGKIKNLISSDIHTKGLKSEYDRNRIDDLIE